MGVINLSILVEKIKRKLIGSGFVTNTDYATSTDAGVMKIGASYGVAVTSSGHLSASVRTSEQYTSAQTSLLMGKGTIENVKEDITARALVGIAAAQIATPTTGTYTVKLTYDGTAWGVTIIQDT